MTLLATLTQQAEKKESARKRLIRARNYIKIKSRFSPIEQILTQSVIDELDEMIKELEV